MKKMIATMFVFGFLTSLASAECRWCAKCNKWHCDAGESMVGSTGVSTAADTGVVIQQASYQPTQYAQSGFAAEVLRLTNNYRQRHGLAPLALSQNMGAQQHAQRMSSRNSMYHGRGYTENVGFGNMTPQQAVNMWINSPGHRRNILGPHRYMDVGKSGRGWVQRFR